MCQAIRNWVWVIVLANSLFGAPSVVEAVEQCVLPQPGVTVEAKVASSIIAGTQVPITLTLLNTTPVPVTDLTVHLALVSLNETAVYQDFFIAAEQLSIPAQTSKSLIIEWMPSPFIPAGTYMLVARTEQPNFFTQTTIASESFTVVSEIAKSVQFMGQLLALNGKPHQPTNTFTDSLQSGLVIDIPVANRTTLAANIQLRAQLYHDGLRLPEQLIATAESINSIAAGEQVAARLQIPPLAPARYQMVLELRHGNRTETILTTIHDQAASPMISVLGVDSFPVMADSNVYACVEGAVDGHYITFSLVDGRGYTREQTRLPVASAGLITFSPTSNRTMNDVAIFAHLDANGTLVSGREFSLTCMQRGESECYASSAWNIGLVAGYILVGIVITLIVGYRLTHGRIRRRQRQLAAQLLMIGFAVTSALPLTIHADALIPPLPPPPPLFIPPLPPPPPLFIPPLLPIQPVPPPAPIDPDPVQPEPPVDNQPPLAPTIEHDPTVLVGVPLEISIRAVDPDNDPLYYEIDWNGDNVTDQLIPVTSTVPSGTMVQTTRSWATAGGKIFHARAVDSQGAASPWHGSTVTVVQPQGATVTLEAWTSDNPTWSASDQVVQPGATVRIRWSSTDATACTSTNFVTGGAPQNTVGVVVPTPTPGSFSDFIITCSGTGAPSTDIIRITTATIPLPSLTVGSYVNAVGPGGDRTVTVGQTVHFEWTSTNATHCNGFNVNTDGAISGYVPVTLPAPGSTVTIGAICFNSANDSVTQSVQITVLPLVSVQLSGRTAVGAYQSNSLSIAETESLFFSWTSQHATQCESTDFTVGAGDTRNKLDVPITPIPPAGTSKLYRLVCTGPGGSAQSDLLVTTVTGGVPPIVVLDPQPVVTADPAVVRHGARTNLRYSVAHAGPMVCVLTGAKLPTAHQFIPQPDQLEGSITSPEITSTQSYTFTCTLATGETFTSSTSVDTVGTIEEI